VSQEGHIEEDPYVYPGTPVLRNLAEIRDAERVDWFESDHCFGRLLELYENPLALGLDLEHQKRIHQYLFQDVYAWAGEFRTVNLAKGNSFFAQPEHILPELQKLLAQLEKEHFLRGIDARGFSERAAHYMAEINALHPFREGNGRTQREFLRELAVEARHELSWSLVTREEMLAASIESFQVGSSAGFAALLKQIIRPLR
jgi:cell filamentation protein